MENRFKDWSDQKLADEYLLLEKKQDEGRGCGAEEDELCAMIDEVSQRRKKANKDNKWISHYDWLNEHASPENKP